MNITLKTILSITAIAVIACGGTHGKIASFEFNTPKDSVEKIINKIVGNDSLYFIPNDYTNYKDIYIANSNFLKNFTYHFYGDSTYWKNNKTSVISLVYVKKGDSFFKESELSIHDCRVATKNFNEHFIAHIRAEIDKK